jgi:hypothetical protein
MCRWATEDPNPGEKIAEQRRIEETGKKAIAGMLDEELIEATQTLRALEDGDEEDFYPIEASKGDGQDVEEEDERPTKRIRNGESNGSGNGASGAKTGMLGGEALENIRFYAEMSRKQAEEERKRKVPVKTGMSLLGGYGSGDESD